VAALERQAAEPNPPWLLDALRGALADAGVPRVVDAIRAQR